MLQIIMTVLWRSAYGVLYTSQKLCILPFYLTQSWVHRLSVVHTKSHLELDSSCSTQVISCTHKISPRAEQKSWVHRLSVAYTKSHPELNSSLEYTGYQLHTLDLTQSWTLVLSTQVISCIHKISPRAGSQWRTNNKNLSLLFMSCCKCCVVMWQELPPYKWCSVMWQGLPPCKWCYVMWQWCCKWCSVTWQGLWHDSAVLWCDRDLCWTCWYLCKHFVVMWQEIPPV